MHDNPSHANLLLQAIARSHRIGQTKEVRVIHFEAVADADEPSASQQEQEGDKVMLPPGHRVQDKVHGLDLDLGYSAAIPGRLQRFSSDLNDSHQRA